MDIGNNNFSTAYKKNLADKARKMEKVYGPKAVNQFKGKYKRDITDATYMDEHRKIQNYQAALDLLEESKKQVQLLKEYLENEMPKELKKLEDAVKAAEEKLVKITEQYHAVIDAERELNKHIRTTIKIKEEDIKDKVNRLYYDNKFSQLEEQLTNVRQEIAILEEKLNEKLNATVVSDNMSQSSAGENKITQEDINAELLEEDLNLRKKFDELKSAQDKLKKVVKPNLKSMEDERHSLETQIDQLKSSVKSQYEKYKELKVGLKAAADAVKEKQAEFEQSPNMATFIDPYDDDEVDQEVKNMNEGVKSRFFENSKEFRKSDNPLQMSNRKQQKNIFEKVKERMDKQHDHTNVLGQEISKKIQLSQLTSSLEICLHGTSTFYKVNLEDSSPIELEFFEKILCLLEGRNILQPTKIADPGKNSKRERLIMMTDDLQYFLILNKAQFEKLRANSDNSALNDLEGKENPNEFSIKSSSPTKKQVQPAGSLRGYEHKIKVTDMFKLVIPNITRDIVRIQKNLKSSVSGDGLFASKEAGKFVHKSKKYTESQLLAIAKETTEYPFTIHFNDFDLNVVATSYADFRDITKAIESLLNLKNRNTPNMPVSGLSKMLKKEAKRISVFHKKSQNTQ